MEPADMLRRVVTGVYKLPKYHGRFYWSRQGTPRPAQTKDTLDMNENRLLDQNEDSKEIKQYEFKMPPHRLESLRGTDFLAQLLKGAQQLNTGKLEGNTPYVLDDFKTAMNDHINLYQLGADDLDDIGQLPYNHSPDYGNKLYVLSFMHYFSIVRPFWLLFRSSIHSSTFFLFFLEVLLVFKKINL